MNAFLVIFIGICILLWIGAELYALAKRSRNRYRIRRVDPSCERAGSQDEFYRRLRSGGAR